MFRGGLGFFQAGGKIAREAYNNFFTPPPRNFLPLLEFHMILKLEIKYLSSEKGLPPRQKALGNMFFSQLLCLSFGDRTNRLSLHLKEFFAMVNVMLTHGTSCGVQSHMYRAYKSSLFIVKIHYNEFIFTRQVFFPDHYIVPAGVPLRSREFYQQAEKKAQKPKKNAQKPKLKLRIRKPFAKYPGIYFALSHFGLCHFGFYRS